MANKNNLNQKIAAMRKGGKILGNLLKDLKAHVKPGMTGKEIDAWVRQEIVKRGAKVAYDMLKEDFPGAICISINDELVHGAPKDEPLEVGDKVSFDLDIYYDGYFTDSAFTMLVGGKGSPAVKKMISVTESSMWEGIEQVKPGAHIGDIGHAVGLPNPRDVTSIVDETRLLLRKSLPSASLKKSRASSRFLFASLSGRTSFSSHQSVIKNK